VLSQVSGVASASFSSSPGREFQMPDSIAASVGSVDFHHLSSCSCLSVEVVESGENCEALSVSLSFASRTIGPEVATYSQEYEDHQHTDNRASDNPLLHSRAFRPQGLKSTS
jgi:hypothetical protein